ncbi:MAG: type II CAAX prenyl endopeptidase Rce1 family protein [Thiobacillaceae bacterium]
MLPAVPTTSSWSSREKTSLIAFAIISTVVPWAGWFVLRVFGWGNPWSMPLFVIAGGFCSIGGIVALMLQHGAADGLRTLGDRIRLRGGWKPWAMALLWGPVWMLVAYALYAWTQDRGTSPNWAALAAYGSPGVLFLFLTGPLGEEFGWRGYLLPALLKRWSFAKSSLVIGLWWALWHWPLMLDRWTGDPVHLPYFIANVVVFSFMLSAVLLAGGLLPALAVHWAINASQEVVPAVFGLQGQPEKLLWVYISCVLIVLATWGVRLLVRGPTAGSLAMAGGRYAT